MIICQAEKHTSQGVAACHQPANHEPWADHVAYVEDVDGGLWLASWQGNHTNLQQITIGGTT